MLIHCSTPERPVGIELGLREVPASSVVMDLNLPVKDLETGINRAVGRELMNGALQLNSRKDSLFLKITRTRQISLAFRNGLLYIAAPIKVSAIMQKKVFGLTVSNVDQPVVFTATARMSSDIQIDDQWDVQFDCRWEGMQWETPPVLDVLGIKLDLTEVIEDQLDEMKPVLESKICSALNEKIDLKQEVYNAYQKIHQPIELLKGTASPIYLYLDIHDIAASLGKYKTDTITMRVASDLSFQVNPESSGSKKKDLPLKKEVTDHKTGISSFVELRLPFNYFNELAEEHITGQSFEYEGIAASVGQVRFFQRDGYLACEVDVTGDQNGKIVFYGIPDFDEELNFRMKHFTYDLVEGDNLLSLTDATLHSAFEGYLEDLFVFNLSEHLDSFGDMASQGIERTPLGKKIDLSLTLNKLRLHDIGLTDDEVQLIFEAHGNSSILLEDQLFAH